MPAPENNPAPPVPPKNKFNWSNFTYGFILTFLILAFINLPFKLSGGSTDRPDPARTFGFPAAYLVHESAGPRIFYDRLLFDIAVTLLAAAVVGTIMAKQKISLNPLNRGR